MLSRLLPRFPINELINCEKRRRKIISKVRITDYCTRKAEQIIISYDADEDCFKRLNDLDLFLKPLVPGLEAQKIPVVDRWFLVTESILVAIIAMFPDTDESDLRKEIALHPCIPILIKDSGRVHSNAILSIIRNVHMKGVGKENN